MFAYDHNHVAVLDVISVGIPGNELTDQKAKEASRLNTTARPVNIPSAESCIKQNILDPVVQHSRTAAAHTDHTEQRDRRENASTQERLRTTSSAEIRSLYPSSDIQTFDGQHSRPQLSQM